MMDRTAQARGPAVAGTFYPSDPDRLAGDIRGYLDRVDIDESGHDIVSLVAPHAGYMYSGPVAAHAYRQVEGKDYRSVVVISPAHRDYFSFSSVFEGSSYLTPLGEVRVDRETVDMLDGSPEASVSKASDGHLYTSEHALEVHVPFLQVVLGDFELVPIVMGNQGRQACRELGRALAGALKGRSALIVASSDLSHFHGQQEARSLDSAVVQRIDNFDPDGLLDDIESRRCEACGAGPVAAAMYAARGLGAVRSRNLHYATSGDVTGDTAQVVGYTAGIFYR